MITLKELKEHLQIEGVDTEDAYLLNLLSVSVAVVERSANVERSELNQNEIKIFRQAVLLLVGDYYKNREDTTDLNIKAIPNGVERLCNMIRKYNR